MPFTFLNVRCIQRFFAVEWMISEIVQQKVLRMNLLKNQHCFYFSAGPQKSIDSFWLLLKVYLEIACHLIRTPDCEEGDTSRVIICRRKIDVILCVFPILPPWVLNQGMPIALCFLAIRNTNMQYKKLQFQGVYCKKWPCVHFSWESN